MRLGRQPPRRSSAAPHWHIGERENRRAQAPTPLSSPHRPPRPPWPALAPRRRPTPAPDRRMDTT
eukprot:5886721-Prymnesium_polylepis.1